MTVYVDDMQADFRGMKMSHMLASTDEELHKMAQAIGVARRHWQSPEKTSGSHYDICQSMKKRAISLGAVPITLRQAALMNWHRKQHGNLCTPEEAAAAYEDRTGRKLDCARPAQAQHTLF
ncbi:DUF4031 domain-containing protein [Hydrogenophaga sp. 2FB]|uniref:DUF4031 domain-containing protein n=1 Tax=Hydrogenophaga sp. 2FB TaxID=2502187 RepID=UPI0010FA3CF6|nr:DUF4031 domain-containing protein [Hydrogenophaga sp. 2FB]